MKFINRDHRHITRRIFPKESTCRFRNIAKIAKKKKKKRRRKTRNERHQWRVRETLARREEYLELEFCEKWLDETVIMKEMGASVRSWRSRSQKKRKKKKRKMAGRGDVFRYRNT